MGRRPNSKSEINTTLFRDVTVYAGKNGGVSIGDDVMVAGFCYITDSNHGMKLGKGLLREQAPAAKPIVIENDVWLGQGVTVLGGSHIHSGAVVGAQSLVNGEVEEKYDCCWNSRKGFEKKAMRK